MAQDFTTEINVHTKACTQIFTEALFITTKKQNIPKYDQLTNGYTECTIIYSMEYYLAIRRNKVLIRATT